MEGPGGNGWRWGRKEHTRARWAQSHLNLRLRGFSKAEVALSAPDRASPALSGEIKSL